MAEKEYIEREALKNSLCDVCNDEYSDSPCEPDDCFIIRVINEQPTADVVEVRHGERIPEYPTGAFMVRCSLCKTLSSSDLNWNYCPNCGAKMDGKGVGE